MYEADNKTHEALFGLGRINYVQGRYEIAEKLFIKAYEAKRDFVYRVWLGYTQL
jgi:TolA-binding protein